MASSIEILERTGDMILVRQNDVTELLSWTQVASLLTVASSHSVRIVSVENQPHAVFMRQRENSNQI